MQAVILAGGLGTRLRSLVNDRPKPMASILNRPFLEYQLEFLKKYQVTEVILCVGYLWEKIYEFFRDGKEWDVKIHYAVEETPLGTGGALKNAEKLLNGPFLLLNGDSFFEMNLEELIRFHEIAKLKTESFVGTIALSEVPDRNNYGTVGLGVGHSITAFKEKSTEEKGPGFINAGIYLLEAEILPQIPSGTKLSLEREVFPFLLNEGFNLAGYAAEGYFVDIGTPEGLYQFEEHIKEAERAYQK
jgi:NDP-sugar pyrophosphorylase family protein